MRAVANLIGVGADRIGKIGLLQERSAEQSVMAVDLEGLIRGKNRPFEIRAVVSERRVIVVVFLITAERETGEPTGREAGVGVDRGQSAIGVVGVCAEILVLETRVRRAVGHAQCKVVRLRPLHPQRGAGLVEVLADIVVVRAVVATANEP